MASTWDGVTDEQVWERDGWECKIPGCEFGLILSDLAWPDPLSKSVDHIVPLSLGGTDIAPNKRAAHLFCNTSRSNRMHPDDVQIVTPELAPLGVLRPKHIKGEKQVWLCVDCGSAPARREGASCAGCRAITQESRRQQIAALRERGRSWAYIAGKLGLSGPGAAYNVAYPPWDRYDWNAYQRDRKPPKPPKPDCAVPDRGWYEQPARFRETPKLPKPPKSPAPKPSTLKPLAPWWMMVRPGVDKFVM